MPKKHEATLWQLEVLANCVKASRHGGTFSNVASDMGVTRQQVVGALDRLQAFFEHRLIEELEDRLVVVAPEQAVGHLLAALDEYAQFARDAGGASTQWWIRVDGYWAHLTLFLADAIARLERTHPSVRVELSAGFGAARAQGGAGLVGRVAKREVDLAIAPVPRLHRELPTGVATLPSHRVVLFAAVREDHPILSGAERTSTERATNTLSVARLRDEGVSLLLSPKGHFSRDLLDLYQTSTSRFKVEATGPEPSALVALGAQSDRVPVIASDSVLSRETADGSSESVPSHWPALVNEKGELLARDYAVYYRTHIPRDRRGPAGVNVNSVPEKLAGWLDELARDAVNAADGRIGSRLRREWSTMKVA